ncbi:HutD/Ves family protein [Zobellella iuensis]|uniref:HutD family protein n=1 Tax=Zobellella iuensis TaxID=2803811 RepID=A0ABS1QWI8_9GAMM|nr:HutD family protein [Zobellella iuensis]MBL1379227.1 HutD family protein [Zobellella iuensis]
MAKRLGAADFVDMPWKNGGGTTRELYRLPAAQEEDFVLRVSMARVGQSGPFSFFPGIERILMLVDGAGFELDMNGSLQRLTQPFIPLQFSGETAVNCRLLGDECLDFNVMTARDWGRSELAVRPLAPGQRYRSEGPRARLLYRHGIEPELWVLAAGETLELAAAEVPLLLVEITLYPLDGA